jgi:hypothetical protein
VKSATGKFANLDKQRIKVQKSYYRLDCIKKRLYQQNSLCTGDDQAGLYHNRGPQYSWNDEKQASLKGYSGTEFLLF